VIEQRRRSRVVRLTKVVGTMAALAWATGLSAPAPAPSAFDEATVRQGAQLASIGDCAVCHTAEQGRAYAGGRALPTPFGTLYGTNITPDRDSGIGAWSEGDFVRAMREGIDREGHQLYPAFPYDHFRHVADADLHALYAFLMTRDAVSYRPPANDLRFPFSIRPLIGAWKLLFLKREGVVNDPRQNAEWNRGAYLVAGLGHCGGCHTPRNAMGAEKTDLALSGGEAEGWHAPALDASASRAVAWNVDDMVAYLRGGIVGDHEIAAGPMLPIVHHLAEVSEQDVRAIATYIVSLQPASQRTAEAAPTRNESALENMPGAMVYRGACGMCHGPGRGVPDGALRLGFTTTARAPTPRNFVQIVLHGITPRDGEPPAWMPAFEGALTDAQLADLANYVRARFAPGEAAWRDVENEVQKVRRNPEGS